MVMVAVSMSVIVRMVMGVIVTVIVGVRTVPVVMSVAVLPNRLDSRSDRHFRRGLRIELLADQQHQRRAREREQRYQPNQI